MRKPTEIGNATMYITWQMGDAKWFIRFGSKETQQSFSSDHPEVIFSLIHMQVREQNLLISR